MNDNILGLAFGLFVTGAILALINYLRQRRNDKN